MGKGWHSRTSLFLIDIAYRLIRIPLLIACHGMVRVKHFFRCSMQPKDRIFGPCGSVQEREGFEIFRAMPNT
jgi:hypothetical protein